MSPTRAHAVLSGACNRFVGSRTVGLLEVKHFSMSPETGNTNHMNGTLYTSVA